MWKSKQNYVVRKVSLKNIAVTEENGRLHAYSEEVTSVRDLQLQLEPSVTIPNLPITIGLDAEFAREISTTRWTAGRKVVNRSIAFQQDIDDIPFESQLWSYVLSKHTFQPNDNPDTITVNSQKYKDVVAACKEYVKERCVTHYVHTIHLGAAEYRVLSETEYERRVEAGGSIGVEHLARFSLKQKLKLSRHRTVSEQRRIGHIGHDDVVKRNSMDEAVVGIEILPISTLVRQPSFHSAVKEAVREYITEKNPRRSK